MDALEKFTDSGAAILFIERNSSLIQLAKISSRRKTALLRARDDAGGGLGRQLPCGPDKVFEFAEHCGADFICGRAVEREFQNAVAPFPAQSFALERFHADALRSYIALISASYRFAMASRLSLPLAVSKAFSEVNASGRILKLRIWR